MSPMSLILIGLVILIIISIGYFFVLANITQTNLSYKLSTFVAQLTDPATLPAGTQALIITYSDVSFHRRGTAESYVNATGNGSVDLLDLQNGNAETIAVLSNSTNNSFDSVRFVINSAQLKVNGVTYSIGIPNSTVTTSIGESNNGGNSTGGVLIELSPTILQVYSNSTNSSFAVVTVAQAVPLSTSSINTSIKTLHKSAPIAQQQSTLLSYKAAPGITITSASMGSSQVTNVTSLNVTATNNGNSSATIVNLVLNGYMRELLYKSPVINAPQAPTNAIPTNVITTFSENGLPSNGIFTVTYANITKSTNSSALLFSTQPGNYLFTINDYKSNSGILYGSGSELYLPSPPSGTAAAGGSVRIEFSKQINTTTTTIPAQPSTTTTMPTNVITTFSENGLPSKGVFKVTYANITESTNNNSLIFYTYPGSYLFRVYNYVLSNSTLGPKAYTYVPIPSLGYANAGTTTFVRFSEQNSTNTTMLTTTSSTTTSQFTSTSLNTTTILSTYNSIALNTTVKKDINPSGPSGAITNETNAIIAQASSFQNDYHNYINFIVTPQGNLVLPGSYSDLATSGYVLGPHQSITLSFNGFLYLGYQNNIGLLLPNQTYFIRLTTRSGGYASYSTTANLG